MGADLDHGNPVKDMDDASEAGDEAEEFDSDNVPAEAVVKEPVDASMEHHSGTCSTKDVCEIHAVCDIPNLTMVTVLNVLFMYRLSTGPPVGCYLVLLDV